MSGLRRRNSLWPAANALEKTSGKPMWVLLFAPDRERLDTRVPEVLKVIP
jgi:hypothetical protein